MPRLLLIAFSLVVTSITAPFAAESQSKDKDAGEHVLDELAAREYPTAWQNELLAVQLAWAEGLLHKDVDSTTTASFIDRDLSR